MCKQILADGALPKFSQLVERNWDDYVDDIDPMKGDHNSPADGLTLVAVAQLYNAEITVITASPREEYVIRISSNQENSRKILLGHLDRLNFVSLVQKSGGQ